MIPSSLMFTAAMLLPWVAGTLVARKLLGTPGRGNLVLTIGYGYPLGMLLVVLLVLAWNATGLMLQPLPLLLTLAALTIGASLLPRRTGTRGTRGLQGTSPVGSSLLGTAVTLVLLLLILLRLGTLAAELLARPLFAWDAWMNWAPKAIVWFHEQRLVPFVDPQTWLAAAPDSGVYTLGNRAASSYPPGVPIIMLWHMLALGSSSSSLVYLPWILLPLSLACTTWGILRGSGSSPAVAALGAYLLVSLPFLDVHSALAGYADLWLATYFGLAVTALKRWQDARRAGTVLLLCLFALGAAMVKVPGLAFAAIPLGLYLARLPGWSQRAWIALLAGFAALLALTLSLGLTLELPGGALLEISRERLTLPYLGTLELGVHPLGPILARTLLVSANWHLFWPILALALLARGHRQGITALADPILQATVLAGAMLYVIFGFSDYFAQAANLVTLNRTLLYLLLPGTLLISLELAAWLRRERPLALRP